MTIRRSPLTHGQLSVWRSLAALDEAHIGAALLARDWPIPHGVTSDRVEAALAALCARHDALRARFEFDDENDPWQALPDDPAPTPWDTSPLAPDGHLDGTAEEIDLSRGPAWRAVVLLDRGKPARLAVSMHHLIADAAALEIIHDDFLSLLTGAALPPASSPFDLADLQRSPAWDERRRRAVQHWVDTVTAVPPEGWPPSDGESKWASLRSVPALTGAESLAQRTRTSVPTAVLAAYCRLLARRGAGSCFAVGLMAGNRTNARWRSLVSTLVQLIPVLYRHDENASLADTTRQVHALAIAAYRNGSYDLDEVGEALAEAGVDVVGEGLAAFFNWMTAARQAPLSPAFDESDPGAWLVETSETGRDNGVARFLRASGTSSLIVRVQERLPDSTLTALSEDLTWLHRILSSEIM